MTAMANWKTAGIDDLRDRARFVSSEEQASVAMSARVAARCLAGIAGYVARRFGLDVMQRTCAELVRHAEAWTTRLGRLPHENGVVTEPTQLIAVVVASILPLAGEKNTRSALAFWATEMDPAVWSVVAEG